MSISNLSQSAEITQSGQALRINLSAYNGLSRLFQGSYGPQGTSKMLINHNSIKILKDGRALIDNIVFTHPVVNLINKSASQSHDLLGDGVTTFILFGNFLFNESLKDLQSAVKVNEQVMIDLYKMKEVLNDLKIQINFDQELQRARDLIKERKECPEQKINREGNSSTDAASGGPLNDTPNNSSDARNIAHEPHFKEDSEASKILNLLFSFLNTKMDEDLSHFFSEIVVQSFSQNIKMTEILPMAGDIHDSYVLDGLVLDHSGRHPAMPRLVDDCYIIISNMSLEYEKTEINSQLVFKNVEERAQMVQSERVILNRKIDKILRLQELAKAQGKNIVFMTERGIDLPSLDRLSSILCLRRVKRRNLERLLRLCGGKIVTTEDDLKLTSCGYAGKIRVHEKKDNSYTFVTNTPFTGAKTVVLCGYNQYEKDRIRLSLVSAHKILENLRKAPFLIKGGPSLYKELSKKFEEINGKRTPVSESLFKMSQAIRINQPKHLIYDSFVTVEKTLFNSGAVTSTLLLVDEIIKAGRSVKEESNVPTG